MAIINATNENFKNETSEGLVLVDFWAPWCGPCKMIAPMLEEIDQEMGNNVKIVKVNADDYGNIAGEYGIMSLPTLLLFKNGEVVDKTVGFQPKDNMVQFLEKHM